MLTVSFLGRPERLRHYFLREEREPGAEGPLGVWWGGGAQRLGLEERQPVEEGTFLEVLRARTATGRTSAPRRTGLDLTFSAPKSISIAALVEGDRRWIVWHEEAIDRVLRGVERRHLFVRARHASRPQGILVARFRHGLSRGGDPQLHTHALLLNPVVVDGGVLRSFDPWPLLRLQKILGQQYRHHLARRARSLGWTLAPRGWSFECERYPEELLSAWSKRARSIEAALAAQGFERATASARRKSSLALRTRGPKPRDKAADLRVRWRAEARALDPLWESRRPSADHRLATSHDARALFRDGRAAGETLGRAAVFLAARGLDYREAEIRHTVYRLALGRSDEAALERAWAASRRVGLFREGREPEGVGTPRTGWDAWYRPRGAEVWTERLRRLLLPEGGRRTRARDAPVMEIRLDVHERGYAALRRALTTALDLGCTPRLLEQGTRIAGRVRGHGRELVASLPPPDRVAVVVREERGREGRARRASSERRVGDVPATPVPRRPSPERGLAAERTP